MSKDPIAYAEDTLGVHEVYAEANRRYEAHAEVSERLDLTAHEIKALKRNIEDREIEVTSGERAKEHGLSKTAFGEHLKEVLREDEQLRGMRNQLSHLEALRNGDEITLRHHALGVQLAAARMNELEGLVVVLRRQPRSLRLFVPPLRSHFV